jgi:hypothetical protein
VPAITPAPWAVGDLLAAKMENVSEHTERIENLAGRIESAKEYL